MAGSITSALEILELSHIPGGRFPNVYSLGLASSRVTFHDQQQRAINIVNSLVCEDRVHGNGLAVIGAGIGGVTGAAFAAKIGIRAELFESNLSPFALQQGSSRWVHPNIYDWPSDGWQDPQTRLPCFNWAAGSAGEVAAQLRSEWTQVLSGNKVGWHPQTKIDSLKKSDDHWHLVSSKRLHGPFDAVLLAIGFGTEATIRSLDANPYWRNDDLNQRRPSGGSFLVSGCGDGGLIDAVRVAFIDFRHEMIADIAVLAAQDPKFVAEILRIERATHRYTDGQLLSEGLLSLESPSKVDDYIKGYLINRPKVVLNGPEPMPFSRKSCLLNRFLVSRLIRLGAVEYKAGTIKLPAKGRGADGRFEIKFGAERISFDEVVIRHGVKDSPTKNFEFLDRDLGVSRSFLRSYSSGVDRTRRQIANLLKAPIVPPNITLAEEFLNPVVVGFICRKSQQLIQQELVARGIKFITQPTIKGSSFSIDFREGPTNAVTLTFELASIKVTVSVFGLKIARSLEVSFKTEREEYGRSVLRGISDRVGDIVSLALEGRQ